MENTPLFIFYLQQHQNLTMDLGKVQKFSNARTMRSLLSTDVMDQYNVSRMALMKLIAQVLMFSSKSDFFFHLLLGPKIYQDFPQTIE